MVELKQIQFRKAYPLHHIEPIGFLPKTEEAAALWQFLIMAMQALDRVEKQVTLEGRPDTVVNLMNLAHSAKNIYGLTTLEGMFQPRLIAAAKREAVRSRLHWDSRIDAWFESGGKSYNIADRDPDKVGL